MKNIGAIKHKLNQVRFRHLKKRLEAELRPTPGNCAFNIVLPKYQPIKGPPTEHPSVGVCTLEVNTSTRLLSYCDDRIDGGKRAAGCNSFCPRKGKEDIKLDFQQKLEAMSLPEVAFHYPDMAALIWVLDASDLIAVEDALSDTEDPTPVVVTEDPPVAEVPADTLVEEPAVTAPPEPAPVIPPEVTPQASVKPWYARLLGVL